MNKRNSVVNKTTSLVVFILLISSAYAVENSDFGNVIVFEVQVDEDMTDLFVPTVHERQKMPLIVFLQGGKVDKSHYSQFSKHMAAHGYVVAVPNHKGLFGENMTENKVLFKVWEFVKNESENVASFLYQKLDNQRLVLMGHSFGGVASLNIMQNKCRFPSCLGRSQKHPPQLKAVVVFGTNTKVPRLPINSKVKPNGMPLLYIQGELDSMATYQATMKTFEEKTMGLPKVLVTILGANHYFPTNTNNPSGAKAESVNPVLRQQTAIETAARFSAMFLNAHLFDDSAAVDYIYSGTGADNDKNVEVQAFR